MSLLSSIFGSEQDGDSQSSRIEDTVSEMAPEETPPAPSDQAPEDVVVIRLVSEGSPTPDELHATATLARLLVQATRINKRYEKEFDITFSSMLLAFLTCDDPLSRWFQNYVQDANIAIDTLLAARRLDRAVLDRIATQPVTDQELETIHRQTASARSLFGATVEFAGTVATPPAPLDMRHLMAAYIYRPAGHEDDLTGLRFHRPAWSNTFLGLIARRHPAELEAWKEIHRRAFPSDPPEVLYDGPSTHVAHDIWTLKDALGYGAYAYAIYRFMTHRQTQPPLTISIQAPWGGGKTSLMRMIQQLLDPEAAAKAATEAAQPRGAITVRRVLEEITTWSEGAPRSEAPQGEAQRPPAQTQATRDQAPAQAAQEEKNERLTAAALDRAALPKIPQDIDSEWRLTVWFNAWKYENTNQVWAGLVDAIMQQVAARLPLDQRELFWLRLNLRRVDADAIRRRIYERIFRYWLRGMRWVIYGALALLGFAITMLIGWLTGQSLVQDIGWLGTALSFVGGIAATIVQYARARQKVEDEPAAVSLSEYLTIPDYSAELGFIHHVEADLRRVLDCVPNIERCPLVIFVDDLDRCSPAKVAQVVEAVNLFLAGDLPNCMFVLGMDAEMVAAALQAAHKDLIACLPTDAGIPIGWRFMDKFIQLPFLIPPADAGGLTRYTTALFTADDGQAGDTEAYRQACKAAERIMTRTVIPEEVERLRQEYKLNDTQIAHLTDRIGARVVQRRLDVGIAQFSDKNPEIQNVIAAATFYFKGNPRELKRFVNTFRFQYFLWWARREQGGKAPTLDQLVRWTVLCMRWPEVVRWLRRSSGNEWRAGGNGASPTSATRLKLIEEISGQATDLPTWHTLAQEKLRLDPKATPWLNDDDLLEFFHNECAPSLLGQQLSDGAGKGLW